MERLNDNQTPRGLTASGIRNWGYLFILLGIVSKCLIQNGLLGIDGMTAQQLLALMEQSEQSMMLVTASIVMQALESCAIPIFALLLVEGFCKTADWKRYLGRLALVAAVSEIPYNLAMSGKVLDLSSRNPVFALVLGLAMLWFYRYCAEKSGKNTAIKLLVTVCGVLWAGMLAVEHGICCVVVVAVLWLFRTKPSLRNLAGGCAMMLCCMLSLFYMAAPMGFLIVHFYNGEKGADFKLGRLVIYPAILLIAVLAYLLVF
jgi:hypothetical protein